MVSRSPLALRQGEGNLRERGRASSRNWRVRPGAGSGGSRAAERLGP